MYTRFAARRIQEALADTRVVMLSGPRQAGKTTLARQIAGSGTPFLTLDDATTRAAALNDPTAFVRNLKRAVIDEVQRAPDLLLAIKAAVDADRTPGQFLLTGSANVMTLPLVADSLAGRMEVVRLLPLARAEMFGSPPAFLDAIFDGAAPPVSRPITGDAFVPLVMSGGYPEALTRVSWSRRLDWYLDYVDAIVQRDVRDVARIEQVRQMPQLLQVVAQYAGQLVNYSQIGAPIGMNHVTARKYLGLFESLYLMRTIQPWYTNALKRLTKTPKVHFLDSGLLAAMKGVSLAEAQRDRTLFGPILETFVLSEIMKLCAAFDDRIEFTYFRDKEQNEVDIVMQNRRGRVAGVEVKAAATVTPADFRGLRRLAQAAGDQFAAGVVLYDSDQTVPFGDRLFAVPLSALWS